MTSMAGHREVAFSPEIHARDEAAGAWLRQATLRLRREIAWRWHQRGGAPGEGQVPPPTDIVVDSLDLGRHRDARQAFFRTDVAARYLSELIAGSSTNGGSSHRPGWVLRGIELDPVSSFTLAVGLLARADAASGPIFAACLGDATRTDPTLSLVQRLWDQPDEVLTLADPSHVLWRTGLLRSSDDAGPGVPWTAGFGVPPLVAARLLDPHAPLPDLLVPLDAAGASPLEEAGPLIDRLWSVTEQVRFVPVTAPRGADVSSAVAAIAGRAGRRVARVAVDVGRLEATGELRPLLTLAWLADIDLLLRDRREGAPSLAEGGDPWATIRSGAPLPVTIFVQAPASAITSVPRDLLLPICRIRPLSFEGRLDRWRDLLGPAERPDDDVLRECARRFRFEPETIRAICAGLTGRPHRITGPELFAACRAAIPLDAGGLAQAVSPRFRPDELILPPEQRRQFEEIELAMRVLAEVHYDWGTGRVWNDAGISVLFAGPSGTGKTMAAEVLAVALDIPMYRVNLAQVVDKYIGETEKNLERVFDAADAVESILFFDEADSLFGRRTEVRDAHDRYANLEVSYLLDRMDRFKGLARTTATPRKK